MDTRNYVHYFSVLKCVAMLAVICLHTFCTPLNYWINFLSKSEVFIGVFISQFLISWAVPVFVMVSGALFLDEEKEVSYKKLYFKYILRLLLILCVFGTVYALMEIVYTNHSFNLYYLFFAIKNMYSGNSWAHMWFIYMIIGLYIITPPLKILLKSADKNSVMYLLFILFVFNFLIPLIDEITGLTFGIYIPVKSIYLFYYILGYAIHKEILKLDIRICISFVIIGILWFIIGQFIPSIVIYEPSLNFKYGNFFGSLISTGLFSIAKAKCIDKTNFIDTQIVPLSLGVYVIHQFFLNVCYKVLKITPENYNIWLCWFIVLIVTTISSVICVWLLRKIPFIRKYIF